MSEGTTCYERDEVLCEDQMCLRVGCRIRNARLADVMMGGESVDKATAWDTVAEKNAKIAALANALEEILEEVGTSTKANKIARAALASVRGDK